MPEQKAIKKELIVFLACSLFLLAEFKTCKAVEIPDEEKWTDYNNYIVIDTDTTWSGQVVFDDPNKPVIIVNGATLTIEKGTAVQIMSLDVYMGRILAEGTQSEKIKFTKAAPKIPEGYKPECLYMENGIKFYERGWLDEYAVEPSIFRYVEFENMGSDYLINEEECACPYTDGGCQAMKNNIFHNLFKTALAAGYTKVESPVLNFESGNLLIENSIFKNNSYADIKVDVMYEYEGYGYRLSSLEIANSNFEGNSADTALLSNVKVNNIDYNNLVHSKNVVKLRNNWYGNNLGPKVAPDYLLGGEKIIGDYTLYGWSTIKFEDVCADCASNVMFLPGLEASRLYSDSFSTCPYDSESAKKFWEPNCSDNVRRLYLDSDGKSLDASIHAKEGGILDETPVGSNIYKSFIEQMDKMKNEDKSINDWQAVAYDWRLSLDDILEDDSIVNKLRDLATNSKSQKVTIVAHSNGGLLAKALVKKLGDEEAKKLVDRIIFVAVPQVGTPAAIAGMLHGYKQNIFPVFDSETARGLGENMPGAYNLLPSNGYFSSVKNPVVTFENDASSVWEDRYAEEINSKDELHDFLSDDFWRVSATNSDTDSLAKLNENLLEKAENLHANLDTWSAPDGMKIIQIAGWGVPVTLKSTKYNIEKRKFCNESLCWNGVDLLEPYFEFTMDGDETVVSPSALWMNNADRYWVDLKKYNTNNKVNTLFGWLNIVHKNILEIPEVNAFIADSIQNKTKTIAEYEYFSTEAPQSNEKRLQYSLHSPLSLELYDDQGHHTGINKEGQIEEQIPGTYYKQFGDVKYIFTDENIDGHIVMEGYKDGSFTFTIDEFEGDKSIGNITFKDMPTTAQTKVTIDVPEGLASASNLNIDKNGDEIVDIKLEPKIGEIVTLDTISPTASSSLSGSLGENDWYVSDAALTLSAQDNEGGSGVAKIGYSLDDGATWSTYASPISFEQEGIFNIQYYSIDNQGNREETKTIIVKIDKTAPEAKINFNKETQKLDVIGFDNLSLNVSQAVTEKEEKIIVETKEKHRIFPWLFNFFRKEEKKTIVTAILTDEAGHQAEIVWEKKNNKDRRIDLNVLSISYDGQKTDLSENNLQYKWVLDWRRKKYLLFASHIKNDFISLESHYFTNKNQTWLMEKPQELADNDGDDDAKNRPIWEKIPGMVIPGIMTEKGIIKINY